MNSTKGYKCKGYNIALMGESATDIYVGRIRRTYRQHHKRKVGK